MSGRHPIAAGIANYYEQQQQQQQHQAMTSTTMATKPSLHFQSALQQRLHEYPPQSNYDARYYPAAYAHRPHSYPYASPHYGGYLSPHHHHPYHHGQHPQYDSTYNGRLIGGSSGLLSSRGSRYLPYQHQQQQTQHMHGMFTPAGQQLVPSSVLHYPPRSSAFQQQQPPSHHSQQALHQHPQQHPQQHLGSMYDISRPELHPQYHPMHRSPYLPMQMDAHHTASGMAYNPYAISQHHFQQSQALMSSSMPRQPTSSQTPNESSVLPNEQQSYQEESRSHPQVAAASTDNPSTCPTDSLEAREASVISKDGEQRLEGNSMMNSANSPTTAQALTTSPPLISATGTDSGISSCSTRARSDSTQSTPVYSGEYPLSVGSSSGISYQCGDGKDYDESATGGGGGREKDDARTSAMKEVETAEQQQRNEANEIDNSPPKSEDANAVSKEPMDVKEEEQNDGDKDEAPTSNQQMSTTQMDVAEPKANARIESSSGPCTNNSIPHHQHIRPSAEYNPIQSSIQPAASGTSTNSSPTNERCTTPFHHIPSPYASQQHPQQQQQQFAAAHQMYAAKHFRNPGNRNSSSTNNNNNNSWSPFPSSPNSWPNQYSSKNSPNKRHQSPPRVPVPPHNSPVGYCPSSPASSYPPATNSNRIIECDLIPSKKSKRKSSTKTEPDVRKEIRDMPLPGFQQAFGSTEIGRFSETFLLSPESSVEPFDAVAEQQQQQQQTADCFSAAYAADSNNQIMHSGRGSWSPHESFEFNAAPRGAPPFNVQFGASGRPSYGIRDIMAYERYSRAASRGFNEIPCNGY